MDVVERRQSECPLARRIARETALHSAAWNGDLAMVRMLVEAGADAGLLDEEHVNTPLGWSEVSRTVTNNPDCDLVTAYLAKLN